MRTIDADTLKKDIEENSIVLEGVKSIEIDCAKALIDNAPTVIIDEWISVDATLPKYTGLYLVSIDSLVTVANFDGTEFRNRKMLIIRVDAWQPLPKSYKEVEGEV